jgi:hypothetical protein
MEDLYEDFIKISFRSKEMWILISLQENISMVADTSMPLEENISKLSKRLLLISKKIVEEEDF